ncbi:hypothetical protein [Aureliella helgolandensis]|uniref:hypothetical protein n=1 Tax=Aureliella helgolandensis TaxID=2527968 RepID=UPI0018D11870|nr:hypothetical protein [Aureliella helgolandensis]
MLGIILLLAMVVMAGMLGNAGHTTNQKLECQHAADAAAFSTAMWLARGMNAITTCNHLVGEATTLSVIQDAIGGPELTLGLKKQTSENQQIDALLRPLGVSSPIGRIPSPYVPPPLTSIDRRIIDLVVKRTSPPSNLASTAFATLYDSRMTLKRKLAGWLVAKSVANIAFLVPPPFGYVSAPFAYAAHIAATAQIVLIGKEWLLLAVLEKYALVAAPIHKKVIDEQLIPTLAEFGLQIAGIDADSGSVPEEDNLVRRAITRTLASTQENHRVELESFPTPTQIQLPVVLAPPPNLQGHSGTWPEGWGEDKATPLPSLTQELDRVERELDRAVSKITKQIRSAAQNIEALESLQEEIQKRIDADGVEQPALGELEAEKKLLDQAVAQITEQVDEYSDRLASIAEQRNALSDSISQIPIGDSQNLSLDHIPTSMDPHQERSAQWVLAVAPNLDALRAPLLGLCETHLKISSAAEHFTKWTNRYALIKAWQFRSGYRLVKAGTASARWDKSKAPLRMLVMPETYREQAVEPHKGNELWTRGNQAGFDAAEQLFTVAAFVRREYQPLFSPSVFPAPQANGLIAFSQAIVYNANRQLASSGTLSQQPEIGWDTLNWAEASAAPEWGAAPKRARTRWPWEIIDSLGGDALVQLNWQPKLIPVTASRLKEAVADLPSEMQTAVEMAIDHPTLITH